MLLLCSQVAFGQEKAAGKFTRQDRLRGSVTAERAWWDVLHYDLELEVFPDEKRIQGSNRITFKVIEPPARQNKGNTKPSAKKQSRKKTSGRNQPEKNRSALNNKKKNQPQRMQLDLQKPLAISRVALGDEELTFEREGNVYWIQFPKKLAPNSEHTIAVFYGGTPVESRNPPWSGGLSWTKDDKDRHFISTTCQGIGASIWWPNKDHGADEPDRGMTMRFTVPQNLTAVSNGRLIKTDHNTSAKTKTFHWRVVNPINNYAVNLNIGNYINFSETYDGEFGVLDMEYWVLEHQREEAVKQFLEAPRVIEAFEHWFGKYPFYEDSYKLVAVPYLGMEHQSSVTYGNGFKNGYRGRDLSGTGVGLKFDFIIVHESGHEWFGNNVSMRDAADMWIHESFTNYSECLFVEYHFTKKEAEDYVIGCRKNVRNKSPIIGTYNVNKSGSGDMYYKGGNMLHTMRHVLGDDKKWRAILRGLNREFFHRTVTTQEVEAYISKNAGIDFTLLFDQYLRGTDIPEFNYEFDGSVLKYRFEKVVPGFHMPLRVTINNTHTMQLGVTDKPQIVRHFEPLKSLVVDRNFYVETVTDE